jgi:hypothetical protein
MEVTKPFPDDVAQELFYVDANGKRQDAGFHNEILDQGDFEAAKRVSDKIKAQILAKAEKQKMLLREFDESKHPRVPAGSSGGGQFGEGGGAGADPSEPVDLTPEEQASITYYQGDKGFEAINGSLRKGNSPGEHAKRLSSAIGKHRLAQETVVYRGFGNTLSKKLADMWRDKEPGDPPITFVDKGFVSTSSSKKVAESFSKNTITIKLPKGSMALPVTDRKNAHEKEILIDRGTKFKITNMRKTAAGWKRFEVEIVP